MTRFDRLCAWLTRHTDRLLFGRPRQPRQWTPRLSGQHRTVIDRAFPTEDRQ